MYSDGWLRNGFTTGDRIRITNVEPIWYKVWYDGNKKVGVGIDFEYADDAHFELLWDEFEKLIKLWGGEKRFFENMQSFFEGQNTYFAFEELLKEEKIIFHKIVFY